MEAFSAQSLIVLPEYPIKLVLNFLIIFNKIHRKRVFLPVLGGVFVVIIFGTFTLEARAGFLSFLENIFRADASDEVSYNSQNVPLLQAPQSSDPGAVGGASISFVEDSAILPVVGPLGRDRKSTRLNSSHSSISYAVF